MGRLVKLKAATGTVLVEVDDESAGIQNVGKGSGTTDALDRAINSLVQNEIVGNCKMLTGAFEQLRAETVPAKTAKAEFGLKFTAKGDIYLVAASTEATFKISFEWDL